MVRLNRWVGFVSDKLNLAGGALGGICILVMALIVTYEVIMRYFFKSPTTWVLETSIYLSIASVLLAGGYAMKENRHIQVDLLTRRFSSRDQTLLQLICLLLTLIFSAVLTWKGAEMAMHSYVTGEVSPTVLTVPTVIPHSLLPIGGALLVLELIRQILGELIKLRNASSQEGKGSLGGKLAILIYLVLIASCVPIFLSRELVPLGLTLLLFVLIFGGVPIAFALGLLGLMGFYFTFGGGPMLSQVPMSAFKILDDFVATAVPMFIILSSILSIGGIGSNLFDFASKWVRHLPGGLGVATIVTCAIFAAMVGSSVATVATIGIIAIPEMLSRGYERKFVFGTVAIGGVLGPLIPPSLFMILIGTITGDSVGKLFMAGMLPGIILAGIFCIYIILKSKYGRDSSLAAAEPASWKERWESLRKSFFGILTPLIILGGIYSGIFTPTEAAGVGVTYILLICAIIYRTLSLTKLWEIIREGAQLNAAIIFMVMGAMVFGQLVTMLRIPENIVGFLATLPLSPMAILFLTIIFILILGALMDEAGILLITYPILYYVFVRHFGFDSIWFALVFVFSLEVGLVAPPVGINVFVVQGIWKDAKFEEVVKGVLPFMFLMIATILLVIYFKPLSTWLPSLIG